MKHGESGMTVFRILHKENKWLWVTASSKIVMRHGRPEYIVSTHRPIPLVVKSFNKYFDIQT